jgi:hypothetical protein
MYSLSVLVFGKASLKRRLFSLTVKQFLNNSNKSEEWTQYIIKWI